MTPEQALQSAREDLLNVTQQGADQSYFTQALEDAITKRVNANADLITRQNQLAAESEALPSQLRDQFRTSAIRDPFAQERIIAQKRANLGSSQQTVADLLAARGQRFSDILGRATEGFQNRLGTAQQAAGLRAQFADSDLNRAMQARAAARSNSLQERALELQKMLYERGLVDDAGVVDDTGTNELVIGVDDVDLMSDAEKNRLVDSRARVTADQISNQLGGGWFGDVAGGTTNVVASLSPYDDDPFFRRLFNPMGR